MSINIRHRRFLNLPNSKAQRAALKRDAIQKNLQKVEWLTLVGQKLKQRRNELKLSLRALAAETGLSAAFLSQIEQGKSNPSLNSLQRIAQSLHVSLHYFLSTKTNENKNRSEMTESIK